MIRTDFRVILGIMKYFQDPGYTRAEAWMICLKSLFVNFDSIPPDKYEEAAKAATDFINAGNEDDETGKKKPILMDWEQDAKLIIPAVNKAMGQEIRAVNYMHWWTFLAAYMEIGDSLYTTVLHIRQKRAKGKKLEKWEKEWAHENADLITLRSHMTAEQKAELEHDKELLSELI